MKKYKDFSDSALNNEDEQVYLKGIFNAHFNKEYKEKYARILEKEHNVLRESPKVTGKGNIAKRTIIRYMVAVAACLLIFFVVKSLVINSGENLSELTTKYASADILLNKEIKRGVAMNDQFRATAIQLYNEGKYETALAQYQLIEEKDQDDMFWIAMTTFYKKDYASAEVEFKNLSTLQNLKFKEELKWFYALTLIQNGKEMEAKPILETINSWKVEESKLLIEAMK